MPSQDIRPALRERMVAAARKLDGLEKERHELQEEVAAIQHLMAIEDRRFAERPGPEHPTPRMSLSDFLATQIRQGVKDKEALRFAAMRAGYFENGESAGRATHATLLNMQRGGRLIERPEGIYEVAPLRPNAEAQP